MSNSSLGKFLTNNFIPRMKELSGQKGGRSPVEQHGNFSVLIVSRKGIKAGIDSYAREALGAGDPGKKKLVQKDNKDLYLTQATINKLTNNYFTALDAIEQKKIETFNLSKGDVFDLKYAPEIMAQLPQAGNLSIFISNKYNTVRKDKVKHLTDPMLAEYKKRLKKQPGAYAKVSIFATDQAMSKKAKVGWDVGHGEFGESVSDIKAAKLKKMAFDKFEEGSSERAKLKHVFAAFEEKSKTKINHVMIIDDKGNLRDDYQIVMSMQDAKGNAKDASDKEGPAIKALYDTAVTLAESEGSYTTPQAIHRTVLSAFTKGLIELPNVKWQGITPKTRIKSKGTATRKARHKGKRKIPVVIMKNPIAGTRKIRKKAASKVTSTGGIGSPMQARNMFNATISEAIRENMGGTRLHNVSGRFADSVHVHNVLPNRGTSGVVQYSYMYNPYKVFEGHETRDPRLLIDQTIREQAAEMALGAFTTQRL